MTDISMAAEESFTAYGTSHQVVLVLLVVGVVALVRIGRAHRGTPAADRFRIGFGVAILAFTVPLQIAYFTPAYWSLERALPLQLCDLAWMAAVGALWTRRRWLAGLTYFWGITLTTQAVITPDLSATFPDPVFLLFWGLHLLIVWAAVYLTWGLGIAPDWRSYRTTVAITAAWAAAVYVFNQVAGTNYGYLNSKPAAGSILDLLGPWPWYILVEAVIICTVWALMTWPWVAIRKRSGATRQGHQRQAS